MEKSKTIYILALVLFGAFILFIRTSFASSYASTWDMVDFSLAIDQFDLFMMQPHFPGYPYFIFMGMLVNAGIDDPAQSLSIVNGVLMTTAIIPVFLYLGKRMEYWLAIIGALVVQSSTYIWIMSTQPMSEASAVALLLWFVWALDVSLRNPEKLRFSILASFLFSLVMGIRLSYFPLGIGLLIVWWIRWRKTRETSILILETGLFLLFQAIWINGLIVSAGGISSFLELSVAFTNGHFSEWGGSVATSNLSLLERFIQLTFVNFIWTGVLGESTVTGFLMLLLVCLIFSRKPAFEKSAYLIVLLMITYFIWALVGQNIEKPRHILPLVPLFMIIFINLAGSIKRSKWNSVVLTLTLVPLMMIQSIQGISHLKEIKTQTPASYQLTNYMSELDDRSVIFTWEEERVFDYLHAPFYYKKVYRYHLFKEEMNHFKNHRIFVTDRVLKGFKIQGVEVSTRFRKVKTFQSNHLVDPIYSTITLYEWDPTNKTP
ncbi:nucleoporin-interacting protein [Pseudalkalibacillus berkeleyi]|uniref:Nucleoporin-interacting protein n=1 Tax=Pseudalkalibacillus berkeleyi TaxID=1069813 RepID=A0ABS9H223_9BACL|nr:nucleoporin-interacting protein [Pseudalkalibacillus berkeleyi]MCF6138151.1 nucleoporin-interacting protein [Pseudalkalibacillus berkeleyi]